MRVLIASTGYPRNENDFSGIFIKRLAEAMALLDMRVTVLAPGDRNAKAREKSSGIDIIRFFYGPRSLMKIGYGNGGIPENLRRWPWLYVLLPFFLFSFFIHMIILARNCDIIHANWLHTGLLAVLGKKITGKPVIITIRGSDLRKNISKIYSFVAKKADAITTVNRQWANEFEEIFGKKVYYTPNGVEKSDKSLDIRSKYKIGIDETIVLYIGVLQERKGTDILATAAREILTSNPNIRFLLIGRGDPAKFGLNQLSNVICAGELSPEETLKVYSNCDIFVLPSRFEGRPNVLLEAMASGLPIIATKLPGIKEVVDSQSGILIEKNDSLALVKALIKLANNPKMRELMGNYAKAGIEKLSMDWKSSAKEYLRIFQKVCSCAGLQVT